MKKTLVFSLETLMSRNPVPTPTIPTCLQQCNVNEYFSFFMLLEILFFLRNCLVIAF